MKNVIPPMTDPLGQHWGQPKHDSILIDDTHAVMSERTFMQLKEYSGSYPSGVYPGKMWSRHDGIYDPRCKKEDHKWLLCWYGIVEGRPDLCSNNNRIIILVN